MLSKQCKAPRAVSQALDEIAMGSARRKQLFTQLADTWDHLQAARAAKNVAENVQYDDQYQKLKQQIEDTNLTAADLQAILDMPPADRDPKLAAAKSKKTTPASPCASRPSTISPPATPITAK